MIRLVTDTPEFFGDLGEVLRLFLGAVEIVPEGDGETVRHTHAVQEGEWIERCRWGDFTGEARHAVVTGGLEEKRLLKRTVKTACYRMMAARTGIRPPWGSLTGIRPTRLMYELLEEGLSTEEAERELCRRYDVQPAKARLLSEILEMQRGVYQPPRGTFDLYIGIPFCTTRCAYCSFAAGELGDGKLVEPYLSALSREIEGTAALMEELGLRVRAAYMGGGTPTALTAPQLDRLLALAQTRFPGAVEWTVEAGRPDTIDGEKLRVMKARGITRISVNPQTFSDETLQRIGRFHTAEETLRAFELARRMGFDHINMDLIAALPGERLEDFARSLETTCSLSPESITVHTLAIKRASRLHEKGYVQADAEETAAMVDHARSVLTGRLWHPYYLYRQKYMAGNLENVGYARAGHACLYNIGNMEETACVLALGAGSITKWLFPRERYIDRAPNVRNIHEYMDRLDEMIERKRKLILSLNEKENAT